MNSLNSSEAPQNLQSQSESRTSLIHRLQVRQELIRRLARTELKPFVRHVMPEYYFNWHHDLLISTLEQFLKGSGGRLIISMPPRHGKTQIASRLLPAFAFGQDPEIKIIGCSYTADLAKGINGDIQQVMDSEPYQKAFPGVRLFQKGMKSWARRTTEQFEIVDHTGSYTAAGVSGAIMGKGADLLIIDDPVKNHQEAESKTYRDRIYKWYSSDAYSRLEKGANVIIIMTRWHEDDLAGKLLEKQKEFAADQWQVLSFPAIKVHNDDPLDPRAIGDALWESKYDKEVLATIKTQQGSRYWAALYQQTPSAQEGTIFKRKWFSENTYQIAPDLSGVVNFYIDSAYTSDEENDATAIIAYFRKGNQLYIKHCTSVRLEFPELCKFIPEYVKTHGFNRVSSRIWIEPKASGLSVYQQLRRETGLNILKDKPPKDAKETRAKMITAKLEAGRVLFPTTGGWMDDFLEEVCSFPTAKFDDRVDCLVGAINTTFKPSAIRMGGRSIAG